MPGSPAARLAERIMTADDPDEIAWLRADLATTLAEARDHRPAPRPRSEQAPLPYAELEQEHVRSLPAEQYSRPEAREHPEAPERTRGLLSRLRPAKAVRVRFDWLLGQFRRPTWPYTRRPQRAIA